MNILFSMGFDRELEKKFQIVRAHFAKTIGSKNVSIAQTIRMLVVSKFNEIEKMAQ